MDNYDLRKKEFREAVQPLIDWLNKHGHPHMSVIVTQTHAEVLNGYIAEVFPADGASPIFHYAKVEL